MTQIVWIRCLAIGAFAVFCGNASGAIITSFEGAMQPFVPASGWEYLWNSGGPTGDPLNYSPLLPTTNTSYFYDADGADGLPGAGEPAAFVYIGVLDQSRPFPGVPGGHPGHGSAQAGTNGIERFAIAAFTMPQTGFTSILNSDLANADASLDGLHLQVFVGNSNLPVVDSYTASGLGSSVGFDVSLGLRHAGDKVYVAVGSRADDFFDTFQLEYSIAVNPVPEPSTFAMFTSGGAWVLVSITRRRLFLKKLARGEMRDRASS